MNAMGISRRLWDAEIESCLIVGSFGIFRSFRMYESWTLELFRSLTCSVSSIVFWDLFKIYLIRFYTVC